MGCSVVEDRRAWCGRVWGVGRLRIGGLGVEGCGVKLCLAPVCVGWTGLHFV